ncbi:hypothetical protein NLJ89_g3695 [Agrocybe chaxingu]|uniref:Hydrophobin n=1 Tax=Agrocybe chaxingu TaxID=84603 RepID=A0A9W8K201_9AGAR|nr:hypothetical protein NLJ89_g3695 [Agrocybe chaxingu]
MQFRATLVPLALSALAAATTTVTVTTPSVGVALIIVVVIITYRPSSSLHFRPQCPLVSATLVPFSAATQFRLYGFQPSSEGGFSPLTYPPQANSGGLLSPVTLLLGLLGLVVQPINAIVGLTCNPISVIGIGGNSCTAQPVCCQNNSFNGLIAIGCTPVNLNL